MNHLGGITVPTTADTLDSGHWDFLAAARRLMPMYADLADPGS